MTDIAANVREAKELLARIEESELKLADLSKRTEGDRWRLAELVFEAVQAGESAAGWARKVGTSSSTAARYYAVHERFVSTHPNVAQAQRPSFTEAFNLVQGRPADRTRGEEAFNALPAEKQAEIVQKTIQQKPEITDQVVSDPKTRKAIDTSRERVAREALKPHLRQVDPEEAAAEKADAAYMTVQGDLLKLVTLYRDAYTQLTDLSTEDRELVRATFQRVSRWHELIAALLTGASIEDQLAELLAEEA